MEGKAEGKAVDKTEGMEEGKAGGRLEDTAEDRVAACIWRISGGDRVEGKDVGKGRKCSLC